MKYVVEIFFNPTDSCVLHDVLFISIVSDVVTITRRFDEPSFSLHEIHKVEIKEQQS